MNTPEDTRDSHFTVVFEGDVRAIENNPLHIVSAFGKVSSIAKGDALSQLSDGEMQARPSLCTALEELVKAAGLMRYADEKFLAASGLERDESFINIKFQGEEAPRRFNLMEIHNAVQRAITQAQELLHASTSEAQP